jgi:autotransporter-associated beta strand protein
MMLMNRRSIVVATLILLGIDAISNARGADGTWAVDAGGNRVDNQVADGADNTAYFTCNITDDVDVTLDGNRIIGNLVFEDMTTADSEWTVGQNTLTLSADSGTPVIETVTDATISSAINGIAGFYKTGAGTLTLTAGNGYSGETTVSEGILKMANPYCLGAVGDGTLVESGATLSDGAAAQMDVQDPVTISGAGFEGKGAIWRESQRLMFKKPITLDADARIRVDTSQLRIQGGLDLNSHALTFTGKLDSSTVSD